MPKKAGKGKKGKGKKGKKRTRKLPAPPPLHDLTEIYKKLENGLRALFDLRVVARKKRLEGWFMTREMKNSKNDSELYHDYLEDKISDLRTEIERFLKLLQDERDALAKAIDDVTRDLQKRLVECLAQISKTERELDDVRTQLLEYEPFMEELARLMAQLADLLRQINATRFDRDKKMRHLTNQFLNSRAQLHNHLQEQLMKLIKHCRQYIMPILWNFIQGVLQQNRCLRWKLAKTDDRNIVLAEQREELMQKRKMMALEKPYWNVEWTFFKLAEMDARRRRAKVLEKEMATRKVASSKVTSAATRKSAGPVSVYTFQTPFALESTRTVKVLEGGRPRQTTLLGRDFNKFLLQRLTATREAKERAEREKKKAEKDFMEHILEEAASYHPSAYWELYEEPGEHDEWFDDKWEDYEDDFEKNENDEEE